MSLNLLKQEFFKAIAGHLAPNEWEIEEYLEPLIDLDAETRREIIRQVAVIWPVSHSLCYTFLDQVKVGLGCLHPSQLRDWVKAILDVYEEKGLKQSGVFMADVENNFLCRLRGETGLRFTEVVGRLLPYVRGLSGRALDLAPATETHTDTATIFVPAEITAFADNRDNFLLYKLLVTFQWGLIACNVFQDRCPHDFPELATAAPGREGSNEKLGLDRFLCLAADRRLLTALYQIFATVLVLNWLRDKFRGLMRDAGLLLEKFADRSAVATRLTARAKMIVAGNSWAVSGKCPLMMTPAEREIFSRLQQAGTRVASRELDPMAAALTIYDLMTELPGDYRPVPPHYIQGTLKPGKIAATRRRLREENRKRFIETLAGLLQTVKRMNIDKKKWFNGPEKSAIGPEADAAAAPTGRGAGREAETEAETVRSPLEFVQVADRTVKLPDSLRELAREITEDLGAIPARYVSSALQMAGRAAGLFTGPAPEEGEELSGPLVYDEWDFRRAGFRKNWCTLLCKELQPVTSTFMETTLEKHRGVLLRLKKEFEMLRLQERFARRQRQGNDIDFDATVDAWADSRAGLAPSENLFIRLQRDVRDIVVVFLVDMSSSTEGWVSKALKEALVLMSEALEVLGDRYAIYGFSGMRRLRSELYHIKHLEEGYTEEVKGRIAAIIPIDYTRMGPPIRHITELLGRVEARVRLLVTLSDGKPEDYDDYKGDYAVEDTRHALIEAKSAGIHSFCITIDKKAHDYIAHMYGEVNYTFIDDVNKLPLRIPEIYRSLTT
jgi:nitric oxide reductase NorD protein